MAISKCSIRFTIFFFVLAFTLFMYYPNFITYVTGLTYPIFYLTKIRVRKSRSSPNYHRDQIMWVTYWMAFSVLCAENFMGIFPRRIPFYYTAKIIFLLWLLNPMSKGALTIYEFFLKGMIFEKLAVRNIFYFGAEASILIGLVFPRYSLAATTYLVGFVPTYATVEALEKSAYDKVNAWSTYWIAFTSVCVLENFVRNLPQRIPLYYPFKIIYMLWFMLPQFRVALILIVWTVTAILIMVGGLEHTLIRPTTFVVCSSIVAILSCTFLVVFFSGLIYGTTNAAAAPQPSEEEPPEPVDWTISTSYTLGKVLGAGFLLGKVLREGVSKNALKQKVVIRMVNRHLLFDFQEEAWRNVFSLLEKLRHPNIIRKVELFEESDSFYLVLEYMSGGDLHGRITKKTYLSEKEARRYVIQVLKALKYMHDNYIVHRDLRPENMMFTSTAVDADLKLVEFSFATFADGDNLTGYEETRLLTPQYLAPEILEKKNYGSAVDMWSFGIIVYMMLGGYYPFFDEKPEKLTELIISGEWDFHAEYWGLVSSEAKDFISKLLKKKPASRMTAAQALKHPWLQKEVNRNAKKTKLGKQLAAKKLKGVVILVMAVNRLKQLLKHKSSHRSSRNESAQSKG